MNLLLFQYRPAVRLYKWAVTLQKQGHTVTVASTQPPVKGLNWDKFEMINFNYIVAWRHWDRVISFNPGLRISHPTNLVPVIQAVGDIKSIHGLSLHEVNSLSKAYKSIFISDTQRNWACEHLKIDRDKTEVIHNGIIDEFLAPANKPENKKNTLVYQGTTTDIETHNRNIFDILNRIATSGNIRVTVYPSALGIAELYRVGNFLVKDTVSPYSLISELKQYAAGLILMTNKVVGSMSLPNKLNEYLAAGLPIITHTYMDELRKFNKGKDCILFTDTFDPDEIKAFIKQNEKRDLTQFVQNYNSINFTKILE